MKKKLFSRILTITLAFMMVMGISMMVFADGVTTGSSTSPVTSVTITKYVTTDGNTYAPNTTFNFEVAVSSDTTDYSYSGQTYAVMAGLTGGLTVGTITTNPSTDTVESGETYYKYTTSITVVSSVFASASTGVYHYTLKETAGTYEGIVYDQTVYDVYVFVYQDGSGDNYVGNVVCVKTTGSDGETESSPAKSDLEFTNNYGDETDNGGSTETEDPAAPNDSTFDVTITKIVAGNMGDDSKDYEFTVTVTGTSGEIYKVVYSANGTSVDGTTSLESGTASSTITLHDEGYITIYGLTKSDVVNVVEADYSSEGYSVATTYSGSVTKDSSDTSDTDRTVTATVSADGSTITFTNTKDSTTPTGILLTYGPYALMVIIAIAACAVFFRRRRSVLD